MGGRRKKVLILDSDAEFLISLEQLLEDEGFEVVTTWSSCDIPALLAASQFDLLLLGDHPPEVQGAQILKQLRSAGLAVPCIVLLSGPRHPFEAQYLSFLGACAVVSKWNHKDVAGTIRDWLRRSEGGFSGPATRVATG